MVTDRTYGIELDSEWRLHSWNQKLLHHPHVHCVVPAGGLSPDHTRWIATRPGFFLPVRVLSRVFRGKFVAGLPELHATGKLGFHGGLSGLVAPTAFAALLRGLFCSEWVVYAKRPFGGAEHALRYLGCYTHPVAISNHRLVALEDGEVVFRWRDSAHHNKKRLMRLVLDEFLRRFFSHVLPRGFVRIRHFGFFAHRRRAKCSRCASRSWPQLPNRHRSPAHQNREVFRDHSGPAHSAEARWRLSRDSLPPKRDYALLHLPGKHNDLLFDISH
jgi:hypothetical protein